MYRPSSNRVGSSYISEIQPMRVNTRVLGWYTSRPCASRRNTFSGVRSPSVGMVGGGAEKSASVRSVSVSPGRDIKAGVVTTPKRRDLDAAIVSIISLPARLSLTICRGKSAPGIRTLLIVNNATSASCKSAVMARGGGGEPKKLEYASTTRSTSDGLFCEFSSGHGVLRGPFLKKKILRPYYQLPRLLFLPPVQQKGALKRCRDIIFARPCHPEYMRPRPPTQPTFRCN
mmetsp:Transcript_81680/g.132400  ORF Transcript_81680/g.132400 Transcript_81680/m.132400 type:complete len:230 (-) Transcript_81680:375-1064(-)